MSLSFVSKTIQTTREDGGYDEKPVENADGTPGSGQSYTTAHKPLFEQLRANKEQEEEERAEFQRSIMRGTLALDDEDCAHLDTLERQRMKEQNIRKQQTEEELAAFRAAQADRFEGQDEPAKEAEEAKIRSDPVAVASEKRPASAALKVPKIVVKKRRIRKGVEAAGENDKTEAFSQSGDKLEVVKPQVGSEEEQAAGSAQQPSGLGGLLSGYGSSDDDEE